MGPETAEWLKSTSLKCMQDSGQGSDFKWLGP